MGEPKPTEPISQASPLGFFAAMLGFAVMTAVAMLGVLLVIYALWQAGLARRLIREGKSDPLFVLEVDPAVPGRHECSFTIDPAAPKDVIMHMRLSYPVEPDLAELRLGKMAGNLTVLDDAGRPVHRRLFDADAPLLVWGPDGRCRPITILSSEQSGTFSLVVQIDKPASLPYGAHIMLVGPPTTRSMAARDARSMGFGAAAAFLVAAAVGVPVVAYLRRRGRNTPSSGPPPTAVMDGCPQLPPW